MATATGRLRSAMTAAIVTAIDDETVQVALGYPWPQTAQDIVAVGRASATLTAATLGQTRSREETTTVEVLISVFRPGGQEQEQIASDRAYELLDAIEHHLRTVDPTVGGMVRECLLTAHDLDSAPFGDDTDSGRTVEVLATFTAKHRVRN